MLRSPIVWFMDDEQDFPGPLAGVLAGLKAGPP
jgi:molybdopterin-guanine dinucleotide biosynthesis protein A